MGTLLAYAVVIGLALLLVAGMISIFTAGLKANRQASEQIKKQKEGPSGG